MKKRIQIDSLLLALLVILTGLFYGFPHLYSTRHFMVNFWNVLGFVAIMKGAFIRMAARGHKKAHSLQGSGLVTTGLYGYIRNPMYLGTYLIGAGFALIVWPWWMLPIFAWIFYLRFRRQVIKEEKFLTKTFGEEYRKYCQSVARIFPHRRQIWTLNMKEAFRPEEVWTTGEKYILFFLPILAALLGMLKQQLIFGTVHFAETLALLTIAVGIFIVGFQVRYRLS